MLVCAEAFHRLCRARELLCDGDEVALSVAQIAQRVRISPYHFIRQYRAVFGCTPHQARIAARLDRAKRLLALDRCSVTDVCLEVGFASVGSFSSLFARRVGRTPTEYRKTARVMVQVPGRMPPVLAPGCLGLMARLPPDAFRNFREA